MKDCMKCEYHYVLDKMVHGFYEIRCRHSGMRDHQVIDCVTEEEFEDIREGLVAVTPPKQCSYFTMIASEFLKVFFELGREADIYYARLNYFKHRRSLRRRGII